MIILRRRAAIATAAVDCDQPAPRNALPFRFRGSAALCRDRGAQLTHRPRAALLTRARRRRARRWSRRAHGARTACRPGRRRPRRPTAAARCVEPLDVRQAAAEHDDVRVEDVDHVRQRARQAVLVARERRRAAGVARLRARDDLAAPSSALAGARRVSRARARAGQEGLDAAVLAAVAGGPGQLVVAAATAAGCGPTRRRSRSAPSSTRPSHDDAAADAGAEDHAEHDARARAPRRRSPRRARSSWRRWRCAPRGRARSRGRARAAGR